MTPLGVERSAVKAHSVVVAPQRTVGNDFRGSLPDKSPALARLEPRPPRIRKVILEPEPGVSKSGAATGNVIVVVLGVVLLCAVAVYVPMLLLFAMVAGFMKGARSKRRHRW